MKIKVKGIIGDICIINVEYAQWHGCLDDEGLLLG